MLIVLKIQINLTHEQATNHSQSKLIYLVLTDENDNNWLLPLRPEVDIYKPKVVKGKIKPPELHSQTTTNLTSAKVYNIEEWLNNDSIDESIEQLILSPRLNKMGNHELAGSMEVDVVLNSDTGKIFFTFKHELSHPLTVRQYGIHAVRTNVARR